jgi:hypothetical protein
MRILLIEPNYKTRYAPLGLMKISTMLKNQGHIIEFIKGRKFLNYQPDEIYITTLFTYYYKITIETILFYIKNYPKSNIKVGGIFASLMPDFIKKYTGINCHFGLLSKAEICSPDYNLVKSDSSICFTSRGCIRNCPFCIVPKIEGKLKHIDGWEKSIDVKKSKITFWDNNFLAKDFKQIQKDVTIINNLMAMGIKEIDFNQGLDARLFTEEIAKLFKGLPFKPIRFAFDNMTQDGYIQKAILLTQKYGLSPKKRWAGNGYPVSIYVLYNFKDKPEDFYYRIREIVKYGGQSFPMRFSPHDDLQRNYIGKNWTLTQRNNIDNLTYNLGQISPLNKDEFEFWWGKNTKEFLNIISNPHCKKIRDNKKLSKKLNNIRQKMNYEIQKTN